MEKEVFELWKELNPVGAFAQGLEDCAGGLFIPTPKAVEETLCRISKIRADSELERRLLDNFKTSLLHTEPPHIPSTCLWAIFYHMVLEGPAGDHMPDLLERVRRMLDSSSEILKDEWPPEIRILAYLEARGLYIILDSLISSNPFLKVAVEELKKRVEDYADRYRMVGILKGTYEEIYPLLAEQEVYLRREEYSEIVKNLYGYPYAPGEIEERALTWLKEEMKPFAGVLGEISEITGALPEVPAIERSLQKIPGEKVGEFLKGLREALLPVVRKNLVEVPEGYRTDLMKTPEYLRPLIPTAAMTPMGTLTGEPKNIFFYTVDEEATPSDLLLSQVHEEYGHAVHYTDSALNLKGENTLLERIDTTFSLPISEGISFHREVEFLELLERIQNGEGGEEEMRLKEFLERHYPGGFERALVEISYQVHKWRFIRFLRALSDVRINTGKQSLYQFVEWAHRYTSLNREDIFNQIFIFQETPGYAASYSIGEEAVVKIQKMGEKAGLDRKEINTEIASRGFLPLDMFLEWFEERYG